MFMLAHNDPMWISFGLALGVAMGLAVVLRLVFGRSRK